MDRYCNWMAGPGRRIPTLGSPWCPAKLINKAWLSVGARGEGRVAAMSNKTDGHTHTHAHTRVQSRNSTGVIACLVVGTFSEGVKSWLGLSRVQSASRAEPRLNSHPSPLPTFFVSKGKGKFFFCLSFSLGDGFALATLKCKAETRMKMVAVHGR